MCPMINRYMVTSSSLFQDTVGLQRIVVSTYLARENDEIIGNATDSFFRSVELCIQKVGGQLNCVGVT